MAFLRDDEFRRPISRPTRDQLGDAAAITLIVLTLVGATVFAFIALLRWSTAQPITPPPFYPAHRHMLVLPS